MLVPLASAKESAIGWFYGFKLHLAINDCGEVSGCDLTPGNADDRRPIPYLVKRLWGRLFGDKGYLSQALAAFSQAQDLRLLTKLKKNMNNKFSSLTDNLLLRKQALIETGNDQLKNISQIEHIRHRSVWNFLGNVARA